MIHPNFLIIGSGISGLNFALNAAKKGKVLIVTKKKIVDSNTNFAQGGIAAVLEKTDKVSQHVKDTLEAGAHHNDKKAVKFMVKNSTSAIYKLIELGVEFEKENNKLKLTKEGGHNHRRIAYVGDYTGQAIEKVLIKRVKENKNIEILEDSFALKLIIKNKTCYGAQIIHKNKIENIFANQTILATGGLGQLFKSTTNPLIATGDGIAMAVDAGCKTKDLEFIQFHPTALDTNISPKFLISETVRGEGGKLINSKGIRFMDKIHPLKELAPRDIVAREIYKEMGKNKTNKIYIDITHKSEEYLKKRFPQIFAKLKKYGCNMAKYLIPITPAAHYECGGIKTDLNGRTNIKNLFAFGEVTCTGVHGANRLASNSLLEALVFSNQIIKKLKIEPIPKNLKIKIPRLESQNSKNTKLAKSLKSEIKKIMWKYAGIVRDRTLIKKEGIPEIKKIIKILDKQNFNTVEEKTNQEIAEASNMAVTGLLILQAAYKRKKSLGCHFVE